MIQVKEVEFSYGISMRVVLHAEEFGIIMTIFFEDGKNQQFT